MATFDMDRFPLVNYRSTGADRPAPARQITCSRCGGADHVMSAGQRLPPDVMARKFQARGWVIGSKPEHDLCLKCAVGIANAKPKKLKEPEKEPEMKTETPTPREMGRADRRLIIDEVATHYPTPEKGYQGGLTDELIAAKLNVPRVWVSDIREQFYGPEIVIDWKSIDRRLDTLTSQSKALSTETLERLSALERGITELTSDITKLKARGK